MKWNALFLGILVPLVTPASDAGAAAPVGGTSAQESNGPHAVPHPIPAEAVKRAVDEHVRERTREGNGVYRVRDEVTGQVLELAFDHVGVVAAEGVWSVHHRVQRTPGGQDYFACAMFHPAHGPPDRGYDLDFRVLPRDGSFVVRELVIHRDGKKVDGRWVWTPRDPKPQDVGSSSGT